MSRPGDKLAELQTYLGGLTVAARKRLAEAAAGFGAPVEEEVLVDLMAFTATVPVEIVAMTASDEVIFGVVLGVRPEEGRVLRPEGWLQLAKFSQITPVEMEGLTQVEA